MESLKKRINPQTPFDKGDFIGQLRRKIYISGETVFDILFQDGKPFSGCPGGSALNSCVSLGRIGLDVNFISEFGNDKIGGIIDRFLSDNGVNSDFVYKFDSGKTPLAIALIDNEGNASYDFYKQYPELRLDINIPEFTNDDILLFGSFFSISTETRQKQTIILEAAKSAGSIIIYDVNYRKKSGLPDTRTIGFIEQNMNFADIVKGSDEDFRAVYNANNIDDTYKIVSNYCPRLIYTEGRHGASFRNPALMLQAPAQIINPVSTIGAGDAFSAGIIFALYQLNFNLDKLNHSGIGDWEYIIDKGIELASEVCQLEENYISKDFIKKLKY